jgi:hypothetical protein
MIAKIIYSHGFPEEAAAPGVKRWPEARIGFMNACHFSTLLTLLPSTTAAITGSCFDPFVYGLSP